MKKGFKGRITAVEPNGMGNRLFELGFLHGAQVEITHVGPFGGSLLAIKVRGTTIALRRQEADHIEVEVSPS